MENLQQHLEFVKRQIEYHERRHQRYLGKGDSGAAAIHDKLLYGFRGLNTFLTEVATRNEAAQLAACPSEGQEDLDALLQNPTQLVRSHLAGLPQELLDQLQISDTERFQWQVVDIIDRAAGKTVTLEVLLIALYRATGKIYERTDLANRIYRMTKKEMLFGVPGKKGWYTTVPQPGSQLVLEANGEDEDSKSDDL